VDSMPRVWADQVRGGYRMLGNVATDQGPSRPQIGPSLDVLRHSCEPYTNVTSVNPVLADFDGDTWIEAPVVVNHTHVYALAHVDSYNATIHGHYSGINLYSSVTLFESTDGGASFHMARPAPSHLVATSPYDNRRGEYGRGPGFGMPSSVLKDPASGLYYVMLLTNWGRDIGDQKGGQCLLRTSDIADPGSWRAWGGDSVGFTVRVNATPLLENVTNASVYTCQVRLGSMRILHSPAPLRCRFFSFTHTHTHTHRC
jgi:hypothetical protein